MDKTQLYKRLDEIDKLLDQQRANEALQIVEEVRSNLTEDMQDILARTYFWEQLCYRHLQDTEKAIEAGNKGLEIYTKLNDQQGISRMYRDTGLVYEYAKQFPKALEYLDKSVEALQGDPALQYLGITLGKKGQVEMQMGDYVMAEKLGKLGYDILSFTSHIGFKLTSCIILIKVYLAQDKLIEAENYIAQAKDYLKQGETEQGYVNEKRYCEVEGLTANLEMKRKDPKKCLEHFNNIINYMLRPVKVERKRVWDDIHIETIYDFLKESGYEEDIKESIAAYYKVHKGEVDWEPHNVKEEMRDNQSTR